MIRIPGPDASDCQVEENKVRLVELVIAVGGGNFLSTILNAIQEVVNVIGIPHHADNVFITLWSQRPRIFANVRYNQQMDHPFMFE